MRPLNEIVTRKAKMAIETAQAAADAEGRDLSERQIWHRIAEFMNAKPASVEKQMRRFLSGPNVWRVDYIEGLCQAVGALPHEMFTFEPDDVSEMTRAQFLVASLEKRLEAKEMRSFARAWNRIADNPVRLETAMRFIEAFSQLDDKPTGEEIAKVFQIVNDDLIGILAGVVKDSRQDFDVERLASGTSGVATKKRKSASLRGRKKKD